MGNYVHVDIELHPTPLSQSLVAEIDGCLGKFGYQSKPLSLLADSPEDRECWVVLENGQHSTESRKSVYSHVASVRMLIIAYELELEDTGEFELDGLYELLTRDCGVELYGSGSPGIIDSIHVRTDALAFLPWYDTLERLVANLVESLSMDLHRRLNARETIGRGVFRDDWCVWFRFTEGGEILRIKDCDPGFSAPRGD